MAANGELPALSPAGQAPSSVLPAHSARPSDFDKFWDDQLTNLAKIPKDVQLTPGSAVVPKDIVYQVFSLAVSESGRVQGQLAYPKTKGKFPALVIFQWAGVYPLKPGTVIEKARAGWLAVNVMAHDLPIDESPEFYEKLEKTALKGYGTIGWDNPETTPFLRMFLATRRVLDFVRGLPDWDGRILVTHGTSLGGAQALVAAALDPSVTAVVAHVPAFCDLHGDRQPHPYWLKRASELGNDPARALEASAYYDVVHMAPRVKVPVFVSAGLEDASCPPAGITAMAKALSGPSELMLLPGANHQGDGGTHDRARERMKDWLSALQKSQPIPPLNEPQ